MSTYYAENSVVSSADAVRIARKASAGLAFRIIPKMIEEISALYPYNSKRHSPRTYMYIVAAVIWTAGRVQGIREERARRRKAGGHHER